MNIQIDGARTYKQFNQATKELAKQDNVEGVDQDPRDGFVRVQTPEMEMLYQADHPSAALGESITATIDQGPNQIVQSAAKVVARAAIGKPPTRHGEVSKSVIAEPGDLYLTMNMASEKSEYHIDQNTKTVTVIEQ